MHLCFVQLLYFTHAHNVKENNPLFSVLSFIPLDCKHSLPLFHTQQLTLSDIFTLSKMKN